MPASLWCDDNVDGKLFTGAGQFAFYPSRVPNAAVRVVDKTQQGGASTASPIPLDVRPHLVFQVRHRESGACFLRDDCQTVVIQKKGCPRGSVRILWRPFVRADVVKLHAQKGVKQILHI